MRRSATSWIWGGVSRITKARHHVRAVELFLGYRTHSNMSDLSSCYSDIERTATCPTCRAASRISNARQHVRPVDLLLEYRTPGVPISSLPPLRSSYPLWCRSPIEIPAGSTTLAAATPASTDQLTSARPPP